MSAQRPTPNFHERSAGPVVSDAQITALMAASGYPEPSLLTGERKIWSESMRTILPSRVCSTSTGKAGPGVTSPEIRQIVEQVHRDHLGLPADWTSQQQDAFLEQEAARISRQVAELADDLGNSAVKDWASQHGQAPDFPTHRALLSTARISAMEIVLNQELYELIPDQDESDQPELMAATYERGQVRWQERWISSDLRSEPDETLEALAETVWPDPEFSVMFRIKAGYLLAALAEEDLPLPARPGDPRAMELAPLVYDDLRRDGHPQR